MFVTFEGIEGSGKSTQIVMLANYLSAQNRHVTLTREPGGTEIGDQVRKILLDPSNVALDPKAELLLYAAGRAQHLAELISPELRAGRIVMCDRFSDATLAYQGFGRGLDQAMIRALDRIVTNGIRPDLTMLLDIEAAAGLARARGRNRHTGLEAEARFENEELAFHERVREGYLRLAKDEPERFRVIDAARAPEVIQVELRKIVNESLG
ncbi:MAG TPA: dTMP kinase [Nitrospirota bacterium]|nr:dTMP kinase [Nitrospirota bacterium]